MNVKVYVVYMNEEKEEKEEQCTETSIARCLFNESKSTFSSSPSPLVLSSLRKKVAQFTFPCSRAEKFAARAKFATGRALCRVNERNATSSV